MLQDSYLGKAEIALDRWRQQEVGRICGSFFRRELGGSLVTFQGSSLGLCRRLEDPKTTYIILEIFGRQCTYLEIKLNIHVLPKPTRIVISVSLRIAESF